MRTVRFGGQQAYGAGYETGARRAHRRLSFTTGFFLFSAFVLLLLVALSLPIIKSIYLLELEATTVQIINSSIGTSLRFGVWGFCVNSAVVPAGVFTNNGDCQGPQLGYTLNSELFQLIIGQNEDIDIVLKGVTVLLVLHPIAAGLALLTALPIFLGCLRFHNGPWILSLILSILTSVVSAVVFAADLALVLIARDRLKAVSSVDLAVNWGPGVWMVLAGMVCSWIALIAISAKVCRCCGFRSKYDTY
ncbi:unnamed protein product [Peniophora sp. CBMAI 1063]|nr:unnamed protein product [Peniophora sp. CBMAI 1063]